MNGDGKKNGDDPKPVKDAKAKAAKSPKKAPAAEAAETGAAAQKTAEGAEAPPVPEAANDDPEARIGELEVRIGELEAEVAELKDQFLRALAETENVRRRSQRQLEEMRKYAAADLAKDLLNVADNLRRALDALTEEEAAENDSLAKLVGGLKAIEKDFLQAFETHHIRKLTPADEPFDPNLHQAMLSVENSDKPGGTVVHVLQPGYMLRDRLLRPAMVGVAKGADDEDKKVDTTA